MQDLDTGRLLRAEDVAEWLHLSDPRGVYRLIHQGELTAYRVGRRLLVERESVEAFLQTRRVAS